MMGAKPNNNYTFSILIQSRLHNNSMVELLSDTLSCLLASTLAFILKIFLA